MDKLNSNKTKFNKTPGLPPRYLLQNERENHSSSDKNSPTFAEELEKQQIIELLNMQNLKELKKSKSQSFAVKPIDQILKL
jgi:hypothetical protein